MPTIQLGWLVGWLAGSWLNYWWCRCRPIFPRLLFARLCTQHALCKQRKRGRARGICTIGNSRLKERETDDSDVTMHWWARIIIFPLLLLQLAHNCTRNPFLFLFPGLGLASSSSRNGHNTLFLLLCYYIILLPAKGRINDDDGDSVNVCSFFELL